MTTPILNVIEMGSIRNGKGADERASEQDRNHMLPLNHQPTQRRLRGQQSFEPKSFSTQWRKGNECGDYRLRS